MRKSKLGIFLLGAALAVGAGAGVALMAKEASGLQAAKDDVLATFSSADVVGGTATSYTEYSDDNWTLNVGGNKVSAGWNKTAANAKQVGSKFAIDSTDVTATTYGWVASTKNAIAKAGKLTFTYTGGSGNGSGKLWLGYSADGTTYSKVTLTTGTQGMSCGSTNTNYTFEFDTIDTAYYAIIVTGGASGSAFRFDSVTATLIEGDSSSDPKIRIQDNYHVQGPFTVEYGVDTYFYAVAWDDDNDEPLNSGCTWEVSEEGIVDYYTDGYTWLVYKPITVGVVTITVSHEGYKSASTTITVSPGTVESVAVTGSMTKTSYYVGENWSNAGLTATATYSTGYVANVTSEAVWTYSPASPATNVTSVVATATFGGQSGNSTAQAVTVTRTNPIQVLYTQSASAAVDVYGYYVGFLDGTGPVIMDGAYGIVIYNKTADVSGYTANETILHVTGSISIYNGLYEIGSASISVASGTFDEPEAPIVYTTQGGETADYASRLTTVTGVPTVTKGSFDSDAGTADITMSFALPGDKTVQVFYKKAAQTADSEAFTAAKAAVEGGSEITIKGFTGWYNAFQVQMNGYIPAAESYTAEDFAQDLLDQTDAVCATYVSDESKFNEIKASLTAIWTNLAGNDKYPSLPSAQKTILAEAERDESGTVVEQAMARYDFLTGKYSLNNFINGRTPIAAASVINTVETNSNMNIALIIIVTSVAVISTAAIVTLIVVRKKRFN